MFGWFRPRRTESFDPAWETVLRRNVWQYEYLHAAQKTQLHAVVAQMVARKNWEGGAGLKLADEALVTVAGAAALLTLGADEPFDFPHLKTIIVYAGGYRAEPRSVGGPSDPIFGGIDFQGDGRLGEAWDGGPVVLSWKDVLRTSRTRGDGDNLVLHEFAHHLDGLDGPIDGVPFIPDRQERRAWYAVSDVEYHRLVGQASRGEATLLDHYGATNRAEFFSVSTECFFEQPHALRLRHAELYEALSRYYRQSPADWIPRAAGGSGSAEQADEAEPTRISLKGLGLKRADAYFVLGQQLLDNRDPKEALAVFTRAIELAPNDGEVYEMRAEARSRLGDHRGALVDAERALQLDEQSVSAGLQFAKAAIALGKDRRAKPFVKRALREQRNSPDASYLEALLRHRRGDNRGAAWRLRVLLGHYPLNAEAHDLYADVSDALGEPSRAKFHRERAAQLDPESYGR